MPSGPWTRPNRLVLDDFYHISVEVDLASPHAANNLIDDLWTTEGTKFFGHFLHFGSHPHCRYHSTCY